jgi:nicotinamidase-related amidase
MMIGSRDARRLTLAVACAAATLLLPGIRAANAQTIIAQTIIDSWKSVVMPSPPELQPVTVDSAHTALLILDMYASFCSEAQRPRCIPTIPRIQRLLATARAHKMMVIYSGGPPSSTAFNMPPDALTPLPSEPMLRAGADKWVGTDLEKMLATGGIQSIIVVGTSAEGAVLYTASGAAPRNIMAIVAVDGISSVNPFGELAAAWILKNTSGSISSHVTLTRTDLITMH